MKMEIFWKITENKGWIIRKNQTKAEKKAG